MKTTMLECLVTTDIKKTFEYVHAKRKVILLPESIKFEYIPIDASPRSLINWLLYSVNYPHLLDTPGEGIPWQTFHEDITFTFEYGAFQKTYVTGTLHDKIIEAKNAQETGKKVTYQVRDLPKPGTRKRIMPAELARWSSLSEDRYRYILGRIYQSRIPYEVRLIVGD